MWAPRDLTSVSLFPYHLGPTSCPPCCYHGVSLRSPDYTRPSPAPESMLAFPFVLSHPEDLEVLGPDPPQMPFLPFLSKGDPAPSHSTTRPICLASLSETVWLLCFIPSLPVSPGPLHSLLPLRGQEACLSWGPQRKPQLSQTQTHKARRVVVPHGLGIPESLQQRVGADDLVFQRPLRQGIRGEGDAAEGRGYRSPALSLPPPLAVQGRARPFLPDFSSSGTNQILNMAHLTPSRCFVIQ